jgi:protein O-mannosyl-transferase
MSRKRGQSRCIPKSGNPPASWWNSGWFLGALLVSITVLVYLPASGAGFIWDDDVYVTQNTLLTAPDGLRRIWFSLDSPSQYFPLVYTTFLIERAIWGLNAAGFHWVNIVLHAANALLVWRLLLRLRVPGAWLAAALFALHPVQVESVAWITERKNVLMGLFFLLALIWWTKFLDAQNKERWKFYLLALASCGLALFSKTTACTLPAALVLILWLRKQRIDARRVAQIAPFVFVSIVMGLVTIWWERYHIGTRGEVFGLGPVERILIASRVIWFYLGKLVWPANLAFSYPLWKVSTGNPLNYLWVAAIAALGAAVYFARRYAGRSLETALVFFVATLSPVLGFIMLYTFRYSFVADHYQYLASIGPLALVAAGLTTGWKTWGREKLVLAPVAAAALLFPLGLLTWRQCAMYASPESLWRATILVNPDSWMAEDNLAIVLQRTGRMDEAMAHLQRALAIDPDNIETRNNLGNAFLRMGRVDDAFVHLKKALELEPNRAAVQYNFAHALLQIGRVEEATPHLEKALAIDPTNLAARSDLGSALLRLGRVEESLGQLQKALELDPNYSPAHANLANTLLQMGRTNEALAHLQKILRLDPHDAEANKNMAWVLATSPDARIRDGGRAVALAEEADRIERGNPIIGATLAAAYAEAGRFAEAINVAERALQLAIDSRNEPLADGIRAHLEFYRAGQPVRDIRR